jgi:hypothetical protein
MALATLFSAAAAAALPSPQRVEKSGPLYSVAYGTRSYTFDAAWRVEKAWVRVRPGAPWTPVQAAPAWLREFRDILLRERGVMRLDDLPCEGADEQRALRALGYI